MTLVQEAMRLMETMPRKNQQIVLELLKAMSRRSAFQEQSAKDMDTEMRAAAMGLVGLWKDHDNTLTVEETVRNMRKGRFLDT